MKTLTQVVLPIAVVIGLIAGVTFVSQYSGSRQRVDKKGNPGGDLPVPLSELLDFPVRQGVWDLASTYPTEFEVHSRGHYDFWFFNRSGASVELSLKTQSCTCSEVNVGLLTDEGQRAWSAAAAAVAGSLVLAPTQGPVATDVSVLLGGQWPNEPATIAAADRRLQGALERATWQSLKEKGTSVAVPPGVAVVRLAWEAKKAEPVRLSADLLMAQGNRKGACRLELPVAFVPPVLVDAPELRVNDLAARDQKETVSFNCWSATRDDFVPKVAEEKGHPCFTFEHRLLTADESAALAQKFQMRVRAGYRVTVTVHERRGNNVQLDLGPFRKQLAVGGVGGADPLHLPIAGTVRGEVALRSSDSKDIIDLGSFRTARGVSKTVILTADVQSLQLKLDAVTPDFLIGHLESKGLVDGVRRWELTVTVPPGRSGRLPPDAAVILQTQGDAPRRMRVPVVGEAIQ